MKLCRLVIFAFALSFSITVAAEPITTVLQFSHDFGGRPTTRISLRLIATNVDGPPRLGAALPLYSSNSSASAGDRMHNAEDQRPFCERSPNGCLAFGMLLGVAIAYFVVEAADDVDGDSRVSFTSGSTRVVVNDTR